jgi:malate dehydrogenase
VQQRGAAVIKARGASSAASAASAAIDHVHTWVHGTAAGDWVSMAVPADGSYGIDAGVVFSYPVTVSSGDWRIVPGLSLDEFSRGRLDATHAELREERDGVRSLLG